MKFLPLVFFAGLLTAALAAPADNPFAGLIPPYVPAITPAIPADADAAWKAVETAGSMEVIVSAAMGKKGRDEQMAAIRRHIVEMSCAAAAFCREHPEDPRRWRAIQLMAPFVRDLANEDGTPKAPIPGVEWDPAAFVAWRRQILDLSAAAKDAPDAPPEVLMRAEATQPGGFHSVLTAAQKAVGAKEPANFAPVLAGLIHLAAKYPTVEGLGQQTTMYFSLRKRGGATKEERLAEAGQLADSPNAAVQQAARTEIEQLTSLDKPFELAFTAVDGRAVDITKLKGKVVLVDFWATWCGPCIAELPNIKQVYAAYHDKGFEIIGISLENAALRADDTPEKAAAKHEKAKQILTDFTTKTEMPWPQYYDGKHWKNDISTRFGIGSIPAMFLLDQDGKVVSTNARGPALEAEVKRLLKL